ncbi:YdbL family protein [Sphingomonas sp.]|uniref:YdbL family protein n=1 Tax=Sphingomonas sp. TaxID=28214 RepID=UPI00181079F3|nr:YdbL family protein [Sphingomonas sp.]MBA3510289.1 YdbL family protein [Sphingomonas sp.]
MRRLLFLGAAGIMAVAVPSSAQTPAVDAARQAGQVGERYDGYLGYVGMPSAVARSQVSAINIRRRALYSNLARSRRVAPQEVGIAAGCQLLARVQVEQAYMLVDGQWRLRLAGQPAPVPQYCR